MIALFGQCDANPQEGPQERSRELQVSQFDLGVWQSFGADHLEYDHVAHDNPLAEQSQPTGV